MRTMRAIATAGLAASLLAVSARGATLRVPAEFSTIQDGIDAAAEGDTVLVAPGVYAGTGNINLDFAGVNMALLSESGAAATIIDCELPGDGGVYLHSAEDRTSLVAGFTIRGGIYGITCHGASPRVEDCIFEGPGYGFGARDSAPEVLRCVFAATLRGVYARSGCDASITDCEFYDNKSSAIVCDSYARLTARNCLFRKNYDDWGGALILSGAALVENCHFVENSAEEGGAIFCYFNQAPQIIGCTFCGNSAHQGGAVYCADHAFPEIRGCTFADNSATKGGGIYCCASSSPEISDSIVAFGPAGEAVFCEDGSSPFVMCCDLYGNAGGDWVGYIAPQFGVRGNISADPRFCAADNPLEPFSLRSDSPCADSQHPLCGQIGAWGIGCAVTAITDGTWGTIKARYR